MPTEKLFQVSDVNEDATGILSPEQQLLLQQKGLLNVLHPWMRDNFSDGTRKTIGGTPITGIGYNEPIVVRRPSDSGARVGNYFLVRIGSGLTLSYVLSLEVEGMQRELMHFDLNLAGVENPSQAINQAKAVVTGITR